MTRVSNLTQFNTGKFNLKKQYNQINERILLHLDVYCILYMHICIYKIKFKVCMYVIYILRNY